MNFSEKRVDSQSCHVHLPYAMMQKFSIVENYLAI